MDRDLDALLERRVLLIEGEIDEGATLEVIARMLYLESRGTQEMLLLVDSVGGDHVAGAAIAYTIADLRAPVATHANVAGGIACLILAAGAAGHRSISPSGALNLTPLTSPTASPEELRHLTSIYCRDLAKHTSLSEDDLDDALQFGLRLTPERALRAGFIDTISPTEKALCRLAQGARERTDV